MQVKLVGKAKYTVRKERNQLQKQQQRLHNAQAHNPLQHIDNPPLDIANQPENSDENVLLNFDSHDPNENQEQHQFNGVVTNQGNQYADTAQSVSIQPYQDNAQYNDSNSHVANTLDFSSYDNTYDSNFSEYDDTYDFQYGGALPNDISNSFEDHTQNEEEYSANPPTDDHQLNEGHQILQQSNDIVQQSPFAGDAIVLLPDDSPDLITNEIEEKYLHISNDSPDLIPDEIEEKYLHNSDDDFSNEDTPF